MADQNAIRGGGLTHEGSLRAAKRLKEVRSAAFELFFKSNFVAPFASSQHLYAKAFKRARFCVVTWPRAEISTENVKTLKDLDSNSQNQEKLDLFSMQILLGCVDSIFDSIMLI